jgi:glycosyltransferase involved in cell wall biosynthesis
MIIDQFLTVLPPPGDGISDFARAIRDYLRQKGFTSRIYVKNTLPQTAHEVSLLDTYQPKNINLVLVHYFDTELIEYIVRYNLRVQLLFHNITPAEFFIEYDRNFYKELTNARKRLTDLLPYTYQAFGNSRYTELELRQLGFIRSGTFILNIPQRFANVTPDVNLLQTLKGKHFLLFVGRLAPNKCQADLIKLLWLYRQLDKNMELYLVGSMLDWSNPYATYMRQLTIELELDSVVHFCGHVSQSELAAYYRRASAYVSMSEHEGFGIPLVESMLHDLPVLAYASTAVNEVVEQAGILIRHKRLEEWAITLKHFVNDQKLRQNVIAAQRQRLVDYSEVAFEQSLETIISVK